MEMTGRPEDGLGWMAAREALWSTPGHMNQVHIWWHKALFHLELGQYEAALALYDGPIRATQRPVALSLTNASALLWRLDTLGCESATAGASWPRCGRATPTGNASSSPTSTPRWPSCARARKQLVERRLAAMRADRGERRRSRRPLPHRRHPDRRGPRRLPPRRLCRGGRAAAAGPCRSMADRRQPRAARRRQLDPDRGRHPRRPARRRPVARPRAPRHPPRSAPNRRFLRRAEAIAA